MWNLYQWNVGKTRTSCNKESRVLRFKVLTQTNLFSYQVWGLGGGRLSVIILNILIYGCSCFVVSLIQCIDGFRKTFKILEGLLNQLSTLFKFGIYKIWQQFQIHASNLSPKKSSLTFYNWFYCKRSPSCKFWNSSQLWNVWLNNNIM